MPFTPSYRYPYCTDDARRSNLVGLDVHSNFNQGCTFYTAADLDWLDKTSRSTVEMNNMACRPPIAQAVVNMSRYDTVYIGFPIWWYEAPRIIQTFWESYDLTGKALIPFATSGGSGMGNTDAILQKSAPKGNWKLGKRMRSDAQEEEVAAWVKSLNP